MKIEDIPIENLPNTSFITIRKFKSLGINTYFDLLNYFPYRYENYSLISPVNKLQEGEIVTVIGHIVETKQQITRRGFRLQFFKLADDTGVVELTFYNQSYLLTILKKGMKVAIAGQVKKFGRKLTIEPKEYEIVNSHLIHTGRLVPIYPEKRGLSSRTIREKMYFILDTLRVSGFEEIFPKEIISYNNLIDEQTAYQKIHFPENLKTAEKAKQRLAFNELFLIQLSSQLVKKEWKKEKVGNKFMLNKMNVQLIDRFKDSLPFKLTNAQKRVWDEIRSDLLKTVPMNRFLQGEVGSGKTVIAALACYLAHLNGYQSLFMAPTEILAQQHYNTITSLFKKFQIRNSKSEINPKSQILNPKTALITGSQKISNLQLPSAKPASSFQQPISNFDIIIGTHALISKKRNFNRVGLVIIDEQHRFGVAQRAELKNKGLNPHLLTMTATPIPRTVALTLYGELDLSIIDEMPVGRLAVKTFFVPKAKRQSCYQWIKSQISQVFIVCPLIEESEIETMKSVKAAKIEFENLKKIFSVFKLGLLHGKMKSKEKNAIMTAFKNRSLDILVTTPVVEVGVDVPNATIMLIEAAERFGLAQLHQLRGRVGRSNRQSYCFLFSEKEDLGILGRLRFFAKTNDGNKLAEEDLKIRGPGNIYGIKQHGYLDLKIASLSDYPLIEKTKKAVEYFEKHYDINQFKLLKERVEKYRRGNIAQN
ncbi:DNA helicase RecG [Candidatus Roizmanbacteria bacterium CG_4_9_14_0_2_um_filter_35_15]|uniref:ATP-dependent DNA helicase RecG n=3 Tax=Candidatus Roizmaniibacteriota TaxID=1752723 RepID=A0A2M8F2H9_9BACT|nr:MAG: DNA helicase RecG [Candidatus Roizmanbacteria bacterium CG_4_9_14_0_2_um_filter_35_15]